MRTGLFSIWDVFVGVIVPLVAMEESLYFSIDFWYRFQREYGANTLHFRIPGVRGVHAKGFALQVLSRVDGVVLPQSTDIDRDDPRTHQTEADSSSSDAEDEEENERV